ncbi:hypothetical protein ID866_9511 [Astraeus odoratus]|nr:hypothetical protein ID866_9511 [Astraeus odoratus]
MAQAAAMGPPLSPRETRRSGRRSGPSASASTSKSPDSLVSESAPRIKDPSSRPALSISNNNGRSKRPKQEDPDDTVPHKNSQPNGSAANHGNTNGRAKRKGKEKERIQATDLPIESSSSKVGSSSAPGATEPQEEDVEEQGITRCICGMNEEDADGGEFMVQCETCNVWQHGLCMGFKLEEELQDDYHCEQCKPERHSELLRRLAKKGRQSSTHSHNTTSRLSRSHSPTHTSKPSKRRNTMNSRDAAFDESLKEIMEATAAEAAATESQTTAVVTNVNGQAEAHEDDSNCRKKRKRGEDDAAPKKRTRSASSASEQLEAASAAPEEPLPPPLPKRNQPTAGKSGSSRNRRGGGGSRKAAAASCDAVVTAEGDEASSKRPAQNSRSKAAPVLKRPPQSSHASGGITQDHIITHKRHHAGGGSNTAENSRAYRNSHAYAVSQQPLFTSWNLPDYLAHLEHMLPTDTPRPLEVRSAIGPGGRESIERTIERGVRVKWPSKRMSVGDMNKRVRALVEWVGREQAGALDRGRRREALEKSLAEMKASGKITSASAYAGAVGGSARGSPMNLDGATENPAELSQPSSGELPSNVTAVTTIPDSKSTMKMMEELMEELINFQERFGPGVKNRDRERRLAS